MNKEVIQYEYLRTEYNDNHEYNNRKGTENDKANELGKKGWEMIGYFQGSAVYKRPVGVINMELEETVVRKPNRDEVFSSNRSN